MQIKITVSVSYRHFPCCKSCLLRLFTIARVILGQDDKSVDAALGHGLEIRAIGCVYFVSNFYIARYFLHFIIELKSQMHLLLPRSYRDSNDVCGDTKLSCSSQKTPTPPPCLNRRQIKTLRNQNLERPEYIRRKPKKNYLIYNAKSPKKIPPLN